MDLTTATDRIAALDAPAGPGFFRLNDSKAKAYACFWVNDEGQIALISKNYRSARSRNKMQQRLEGGDYQAEPVTFQDSYGYEVINGGNKIIAAGPLYATAEERDRQLATLPAALLPETAAPPPPPNKVAAREAGQRHSFRLNFYRGEQGKKWQGKIVHPLTEAKKSFQGVDLEAIEIFVRSILEAAPAQAPKEAKRTTAEPEDRPLQIVYRGRPMKGGAIQIGESVNVSLEMQGEKPGRDYQIHVYAKSLPEGEQIELDNQVVHTTAENRLEVPIATDTLAAGLYRFNAEVSPTNQGTKKPSPVTRATSLIQFI